MIVGGVDAAGVVASSRASWDADATGVVDGATADTGVPVWSRGVESARGTAAGSVRDSGVGAGTTGVSRSSRTKMTGRFRRLYGVCS